MFDTTETHIPAGLKNLLILEVLFLGLAVCVGLYIWIGIPAISADIVFSYLNTLILLTLLTVSRPEG